MKTLRSLLLAGFVAVPLSSSFGQVGISINFAPPPLIVETQPPAPFDGYIWTPGYWAWGASNYYWVPGVWVPPPTIGLLWTPPWWGWNNGVYVFNEGYWGPTVGFYGGINYGYGYFGTGFPDADFDTIGGVVTPAQPLMVIVPKDNPLEVEAFVDNRDIGFVNPGLPAEVKVETFQYTKYGTIPATVATVTVVSPRENRRFDPRGTVSFGTAESVLSDSGLT